MKNWTYCNSWCNCDKPNTYRHRFLCSNCMHDTDTHINKGIRITDIESEIECFKCGCKIIKKKKIHK